MDMEDLINNFLNLVITPLGFLSLCFMLPCFFLFKLFHMISRSIFRESMQGKVVLITGASSGIGEQMAYEYARKGASLVIVARRLNKLEEVGERARKLGSADVLPVCADVSNVNECKLFVEKAINHFGRLDHLVNNAGVACVCAIEDATDVTKFEALMDVNFWGSVYPTYFAIPHLKKTRGKIVVNSSTTAILNPPTMSFYAASKSAITSFHEALRAELSPSIKITIVNLFFIDSEMTRGKLMFNEGVVKVVPKLRDVIREASPVMSSRACAKAIVDAVRRGERTLTEPKWFRVFLMLRPLCPELVEWVFLLLLVKKVKSL